jgi:hypothetical protein
MHFIKKTIVAALLAACLPAMASEYFVVVPVKGKTTSASVISVGLTPSSMPAAEVGAAYSYNFSQNLSVTGDPQYTGAGVTWSVGQGSLPAGLTLNSATGALTGTPTAAGASSFQVSATYKAKAGRQSYQVTVATFNVTLTAQTSSDYGYVAVNSTATRSFTYANNGKVPAAGTYASLSGADVAFSANTCGTQANPVLVAPGGTCTVTVAYTPAGLTSMTGALTVTSPAAAAPANLALTGAGGQSHFAFTNAAVDAPGDALAFPATAMWSTNPTVKVLNLVNDGNVAGSPTSIGVTGANPDDFPVMNNCDNVAAGAACDIQVTFQPTATGPRAATLSVAGKSIALTGSGDAPSDPYYANVLEMLQFDRAAGTSALVADKGVNPSGSANVVGGSWAKVGTGAMQLTEATTVTIPGGAAWMFNADFTIEYWFMPTAVPSVGNAMLVGKEHAGAYLPYGSTLGPSGVANNVELHMYFGNGVNGSTAGLMHTKVNLPLNQWHHIVQETVGGQHRMYINGKLTAAGGSQFDGNGGDAIIVARGVTGYMDALRVTKGVGRYSSDTLTPTVTTYPTK